MKQFKITLPLAALLLAFAASAFTVQKAPALLSGTTWQFEALVDNDTENPDNYVKLSETTPRTCEGSSIVCQIVAEEDMQTHKPVLDQGDPAQNISAYATTFRNP